MSAPIQLFPRWPLGRYLAAGCLLFFSFAPSVPQLTAQDLLAPLLKTLPGPSSGAQSAVFSGSAVAVSAAYAVAAEPGGRGAVKVFNPGTGDLRFFLRNPSGEADGFGSSVALSGDLLAVGAPSARAGQIARAGLIYVFDLSGAAPSEPVAVLASPVPVSQEAYGTSVAISGNRVAAGATGTVLAGKSGAGRVYIHTVSAGPDSPVIILPNPAPAAGDSFGAALAIAGSRAIVGAPGSDISARDAGRIYVFDLSRVNPSVPVLTVSPPAATAGLGFGGMLSLSETTLAAASPNESVSGFAQSGRVYLYELAGSRPTSPSVILQHPVPAAGQLFGSPVAIFGRTVAVGTSLGHALLFDLSKGNSPVASLTPAHAGPDDQLAVALGGGQALLGFPDDSSAADLAGGASCFDLTASPLPANPVPIFCFSPTPRGDDSFASSVSLSGDRILLGSPGFPGTDSLVANTGRAYVYDLKADSRTILENPSPEVDDKFGEAVAVSGDWVAIGAPGDQDDPLGSRPGTVYVYDLSGANPNSPALTITDPQPNAAGGYGFGSLVRIQGDLLLAAAKAGGQAYLFNLRSLTPTVPVATLLNPEIAPGSFPTAAALSDGFAVLSDTEINLPLNPEPSAGDEPTPGPVSRVFGTVHLYPLSGASGDISPSVTVKNPVPAGENSAYFGDSLAIDSGRLAVSGLVYSTTVPREVVYLLHLNTNPVSLSLTTTFSAPDPQSGDGFGSALAFLGDQLAVGAPNAGDRLFADPPIDNVLLPGSGKVYLYDLDPDTFGFLGTIPVPDGPTNPRKATGYRFGAALASGGGQLLAGAPAGGFYDEKRFAFLFGPGSRAPVMTAPGRGAISGSPMTISYILRQVPQKDSLFLSIGAQTYPISRAFSTPGAHSFTLLTSQPASNAALLSGPSLTDGKYDLALHYIDRDGNNVTSTVIKDVIIDTTPPVITPPANVGVVPNRPTGAVVTYPAAEVTDGVGVGQVTYSSISGSLFPIGATPVTVTATDLAGNGSTSQFYVSVLALGVSAPAQSAIVRPSPTGIVLSGTTQASVSAILVSVNGQTPVAATLTKTGKTARWSLTVSGLNPWANSFVVTAIDGNASVTSPPRTFFYDLPTPLPVTLSPPAGGTLSFLPPLGAKGTASLGRTYTVTANAKPGWTFDHWSGSLSGTAASVSFVAQNGTSIGANFVASPFSPAQAGTYNSVLLDPSGEGDLQSKSGLFTATITNTTGAFSSRVILDGVATATTGWFHHATNRFVSEVPSDGFSYDLLLDSTGPVNRITGTIRRWRAGAEIATLPVDAPQTYDRKVLPPADLAGIYNYALPTVDPIEAARPNRPQGTGTGTLTINKATGAITLTTFLADGTNVTSASSLGRDGMIPLYVSLPKAVGALVGTVIVHPLQTGTDISGENVSWFLRAHSGQYYQAGFGNSGLVLRFLAAKQATSSPSVLALPVNPTLVFSGGPFSEALGLLLRPTKPMAITYNSADAPLKFTLPATGQFNGTYTPADGTGAYPIRGAIVGKGGTGVAYGTILTPVPKQIDGTGKSAAVDLRAD